MRSIIPLLLTLLFFPTHQVRPPQEAARRNADRPIIRQLELSNTLKTEVQSTLERFFQDPSRNTWQYRNIKQEAQKQLAKFLAKRNQMIAEKEASQRLRRDYLKNQQTKVDLQLRKLRQNIQQLSQPKTAAKQIQSQATDKIQKFEAKIRELEGKMAEQQRRIMEVDREQEQKANRINEKIRKMEAELMRDVSEKIKEIEESRARKMRLIAQLTSTHEKQIDFQMPKRADEQFEDEQPLYRIDARVSIQQISPALPGSHFNPEDEGRHHDYRFMKEELPPSFLDHKQWTVSKWMAFYEAWISFLKRKLETKRMLSSQECQMVRSVLVATNDVLSEPYSRTQMYISFFEKLYNTICVKLNRNLGPFYRQHRRDFPLQTGYVADGQLVQQNQFKFMVVGDGTMVRPLHPSEQEEKDEERSYFNFDKVQNIINSVLFFSKAIWAGKGTNLDRKACLQIQRLFFHFPKTLDRGVWSSLSIHEQIIQRIEEYYFDVCQWAYGLSDLVYRPRPNDFNIDKSNFPQFEREYSSGDEFETEGQQYRIVDQGRIARRLNYNPKRTDLKPYRQGLLGKSIQQCPPQLYQRRKHTTQQVDISTPAQLERTLTYFKGDLLYALKMFRPDINLICKKIFDTATLSKQIKLPSRVEQKMKNILEVYNIYCKPINGAQLPFRRRRTDFLLTQPNEYEDQETYTALVVTAKGKLPQQRIYKVLNNGKYGRPLYNMTEYEVDSLPEIDKPRIGHPPPLRIKFPPKIIDLGRDKLSIQQLTALQIIQMRKAIMRLLVLQEREPKFTLTEKECRELYQFLNMQLGRMNIVHQAMLSYLQDRYNLELMKNKQQITKKSGLSSKSNQICTISSFNFYALCSRRRPGDLDYVQERIDLSKLTNKQFFKAFKQIENAPTTLIRDGVKYEIINKSFLRKVQKIIQLPQIVAEDLIIAEITAALRPNRKEKELFQKLSLIPAKYKTYSKQQVIASMAKAKRQLTKGNPQQYICKQSLILARQRQYQFGTEEEKLVCELEDAYKEHCQGLNNIQMPYRKRQYDFPISVNSLWRDGDTYELNGSQYKIVGGGYYSRPLFHLTETQLTAHRQSPESFFPPKKAAVGMEQSRKENRVPLQAQECMGKFLNGRLQFWNGRKWEIACQKGKEEGGPYKYLYGWILKRQSGDDWRFYCKLAKNAAAQADRIENP